MENKQSLLFADKIDITPQITVKIPTIGEILQDEEGYYNLVSSITASPRAYMVQLDDNGKDYTEMTHYELFLWLSPIIFSSAKTKLLFGDLDMSDAKLYRRIEDDQIVLCDEESKVVIDEDVYESIAEIVLKMNLMKKDNRKAGNEAGKQYLIDKHRRYQKRHKNDPYIPYMENLVIALVNTPEFKYNYEQTMRMSVYRFNQSYKQIKHKVDFNNLMFGVYGGTVSSSNIDKSKLNFIQTKN